MPSGNNNSLQQLQQQQQSALTTGGAAIENSFAKFDPNFYNGVVTNYESQALPQLNDQYRQTGQSLNYNLSDKGLTNSSVAQQEKASLNKQMGQNQIQIANQGEQAAQSLQSQVANEKSQLYGELQASENPTQIAQASANLAAETAAPSLFAPLGNLFSNWSNLFLANQTANTATQQDELSLALYAPYLNQTQDKSVAAPNY